MTRPGHNLRALEHRSLSDSDIALVNDYFLAQTARVTCDIGLIFGTQDRTICERLATQAAAAWHKGLFPAIIVTGGPLLPELNISESAYIASLLRKKGVPSAAILTETHSRHTQENIENAQSLILRRHLDHGHDPLPNGTAYCFGNAYGGRRFLMTLAVRWPNLKPVFEWAGDRDDFENAWHRTPASAERLCREFNKLAPYTEKGWTRDIDIPALNKKLLKNAANPRRK